MEIAGPPVRRVAVYAGEAMIAAELDSPADHAAYGGRALGREHLDTLLRERAAAAGADVCQPCTLSAFVAIDGGYECTIVDKGTRQSRALHSRLIIAAHGSWESGVMPTQNLRRAAARLGSVRLQGAFSQQRTAHGPDAAARIPRRLWRNGAHRWRPRQSVVLHPPRPARTHAGDNGRTKEPGRRSSRISRRRAKVSCWRCLRRRWTVPGCLPDRCGREFAPSGAMAFSRWAMRQPKRTPLSPKASAWPFNPRSCCAGN